MFTGIIEEVGNISGIHKKGNSVRLIIYAKTILEDIKTGDSIAVNGICLTAAAHGASSLPQMSCTNAKQDGPLRPEQGSPVN